MNIQDVLKEQDSLIVDVRTPWEFEMANAKNSINIPLQEIPEKIAELKTMNKHLILCCRSGARSAQATNFLLQNGIKNVYNGGSWQAVEIYQM